MSASGTAVRGDPRTQVIERGPLDDMARRIDEMPMLPQVLVRVMQLDDSADNYFEEFERLSKEDPTLAVRVVALANSAALAPVEPITTIKEALARIGTARVRNLVAALGVQRVFMPSEENQLRLWRHAVTAAVASEHIARIAPELCVDGGTAYLVGLLHDIGRFVMFEHASAELMRVDESNWETPENLVEADLEVFKFTHSELGYLACRRWGLPDTIADAIRRHHSPIGEPGPGSLDALLFCVQVADRLSMSVLEQPHDAEADPDALVAQIRAECIEPVCAQRGGMAQAVVAGLEPVRAASTSLLDGLGL